jgi:hypothetical protein
VAAIDAAEDLQLACGVARSAAGRTLAEVTASCSAGPVFGSIAEALDAVGTARELAEALGQEGAPASAVPLAELHGPVEARGADIAGTRVHSIRLPSFVVATEVVFG